MLLDGGFRDRRFAVERVADLLGELTDHELWDLRDALALRGTSDQVRAGLGCLDDDWDGCDWYGEENAAPPKEIAHAG